MFVSSDGRPECMPRTICRLWIEKVCDRDESEADHCPDYPELIPKILYTRERSLDNSIITDPVRSHREASSLSTHL